VSDAVNRDAAASNSAATEAAATVASTATGTEADALLQVRNLKKYFPIRGGVFSRVVANVKAVEEASLTIRRGEVVGLVGESGSGKTTAGRAILRLIEPTDGEIIFDGVDIAKLPKAKMRDYRKEMQIIFQDPFASLNPRMSVGDIIGEALTIHNLARGKAKEDRVADLLERVGMNAGHMRRYPHEFSGGQRRASASPAPWRWTRSSSSPTSPSPRSTCRSRRRSSTCWKTCSTTWD